MHSTSTTTWEADSKEKKFGDSHIAGLSRFITISKYVVSQSEPTFIIISLYKYF